MEVLFMGSYGRFVKCPICGMLAHEESWYRSDSYMFDCLVCGSTAHSMLYYHDCLEPEDDAVDADGFVRYHHIYNGKVLLCNSDHSLENFMDIPLRKKDIPQNGVLSFEDVKRICKERNIDIPEYYSEIYLQYFIRNGKMYITRQDLKKFYDTNLKYSTNIKIEEANGHSKLISDGMEIGNYGHYFGKPQLYRVAEKIVNRDTKRIIGEIIRLKKVDDYEEIIDKFFSEIKNDKIYELYLTAISLQRERSPESSILYAEAGDSPFSSKMRITSETCHMNTKEAEEIFQTLEDQISQTISERMHKRMVEYVLEKLFAELDARKPKKVKTNDLFPKFDTPLSPEEIRQMLIKRRQALQEALSKIERVRSEMDIVFLEP